MPNSGMIPAEERYKKGLVFGKVIAAIITLISIVPYIFIVCLYFKSELLGPTDHTNV